MNPQTPTTGDFSTGFRLPLWISKLIHHQWRFYFLAGTLVLVGGLAVLGHKMPWKSDKALPPSEISLSGAVGLSPLGPPGVNPVGNNSGGNSSDNQSGNDQNNPDDGNDHDNTGGNSSGGGSTDNNGSDDEDDGGNNDGGSSGGNDDNPPPSGGSFPTPQSTGPRYSPQSTHNGSLTTSHNGQVIERMTINGNLYIEHSNVTVRDVKVNGTGRYMIHVRAPGSGSCPTGTKIEYTELDGIARPTSSGSSSIYLQCPTDVDHMYVHNVWIGIRFSRHASGSSVRNSYLLANLTASGAHREAILSNGPGSDIVIENNTLYCTGSSGCSSAMSIYGDFGQQTNWLIRNNLFATDGGYCLYGGSSSNDPYPNGTDIRIIGNHFSTVFRPNCGRYGAITSFRNNVRGNQCYGNVWHETGLSADSEC